MENFKFVKPPPELAAEDKEKMEKNILDSIASTHEPPAAKKLRAETAQPAQPVTQPTTTQTAQPVQPTQSTKKSLKSVPIPQKSTLSNFGFSRTKVPRPPAAPKVVATPIDPFAELPDLPTNVSHGNIPPSIYRDISVLNVPKTETGAAEKFEAFLDSLETNLLPPIHKPHAANEPETAPHQVDDDNDNASK